MISSSIFRLQKSLNVVKERFIGGGPNFQRLILWEVRLFYWLPQGGIMGLEKLTLFVGFSILIDRFFFFRICICQLFNSQLLDLLPSVLQLFRTSKFQRFISSVLNFRICNQSVSSHMLTLTCIPWTLPMSNGSGSEKEAKQWRL